MSRNDLETTLDFVRDTHGRDSRVRYVVLAAACGLAVVAYLQRVGFATAVTELKQPTGLSDYDLSLLMAAFMLAYGLVEIPIGVIGDKLGVRHVLTVLVVGWSVLTGLIAWVLWLPPHTFWPLAYLLLLRAAFGMFQGGMFPLTSRLLADWMPVSERGLAQGCLWTSSRLGGALAPVVVVHLFQTFGIGQGAFWILAAVGFVWAALFWPWFRGAPELMPGVNAVELQTIASGRAHRPHEGHLAVPWGRLLSSRSAWCLCLTYGTIGISGNFFITLLPAYLRTHRQLSLETAHWVAATPLACGIVGCVLGGWLSDQIIRQSGSLKWGRRVVGSFGLALGASALAATILVENPVALGALLGLAFFGNDLAMGPAWASCADIGERYAGTLGGAMNMTRALTGALGAITIGRLLQAGATTPLFLMLGLIYLLGAFLWWGVDSSRPIREG